LGMGEDEFSCEFLKIKTAKGELIV